MKWLIAILCVISVVVLPTGVSANTGSDAVSTKPIVIAYIPEHLKHRMPGHRDSETASEPPEPLVLRDDDGVVVGYASAEAREQEERRRAARIAIGVIVPVALVGVGLGIGLTLSNMSVSFGAP